MKFTPENFKKKFGQKFTISVGIPSGVSIPDKMVKSKKNGQWKAVPTKLQMAELAFILKDGTQRIPSRDFIKVAWNEFGAEWQNEGVHIWLNAVHNNRTPSADLRALGEKMVANIKEAILMRNKYKPNAPSTLCMKKNPNSGPLIDRANFINAFKVLDIKQG